jgi:hypothetical protein
VDADLATSKLGRTIARRSAHMDDREIRAALSRHWAASDAGEYAIEHDIYDEDAVLDYPQSGERIHGRGNIRASRAEHPARRRFDIQRVFGSGDLWVTEYVLTYDGRPSYTISVMEFSDGKVIRETQYFADPFPAPAWRARWVSPITASGR